MHSTAWAEIDLEALLHNLQCVRDTAPNARIVSMIKADAYGHGLLPVAKTLATQCDKLGVARFGEAKQLREGGIATPLLLMGTLLTNEEIQWCADHKVALAVHSECFAEQVYQSQHRPSLEVWLKQDTGMSRLGMDSATLLRAHRKLVSKANIGPIRLMTHFSSAEDSTSPASAIQLQRFDQLAQQLPGVEHSLANSAGLIALPDSRRQWVRPGIMLYGDDPTSGKSPLLKPVMSLKSRIVAIKDVLEGESVGYNQRWTAPRTSRVAAIGIGYGDGYPRQLPNGTPVLVNDQRFPLVGRISMDICSIDITDATSPIAVGDEVTLWGQGLPAANIAAAADTISYHLFTGVTSRVPRFYST